MFKFIDDIYINVVRNIFFKNYHFERKYLTRYRNTQIEELKVNDTNK